MITVINVLLIIFIRPSVKHSGACRAFECDGLVLSSTQWTEVEAAMALGPGHDAHHPMPRVEPQSLAHAGARLSRLEALEVHRPEGAHHRPPAPQPSIAAGGLRGHADQTVRGPTE